jgi:hypothetical protein
VQIEHPEALMPSIYSNIFGIGHSDTEVAINFGLSTPSYFEPHENKDVPVARIFLSWEVAENLLNTLKEIIDEHKKPQKTKTKAQK